ncbi:MAG: hypothetical protein Q7S40_17475 [Opitutaceae bacterium]|nr:hypothetical protein [Opitutaceae bacterium]
MKRRFQVVVFTLAPWGAIFGSEPSHPSLFFARDELPVIRARAESTGWLRQTRDSLIATADRMLVTPTNPYPLLEAGRGIAGRALQQRVGLLAFAGHLTANERYSAKAKAILLAATRQTDPRNHRDWETHLQYSDAAQAFAIGYDWLAPFMTEAERTEVRKEVAAFGELIYTDESAWGKPDPGVTSCNHNAVQYGALGLCALVLGDRPEWLARATERIRGYFHHFVDGTGYATEGHDYMSYGLVGALPFAMALLRQGGPDLVAEQPAFPLTSDQLLWKLLPFEGRMLAMNDNNENACTATVVYAMLRYRQPTHLWAWLESVGGPSSEGAVVGSLRKGLAAPFLFLWAYQPLEPQAPTAGSLPLGHRFESGRVFLRSSWTDPAAAHVSFTSGYDFHRGHNHQDENAVTLYALGDGFLIDPGYQPAGSRSHNTLRHIGGAEQVPNSSGRVIAYREDDHGAFVRGQAPEAYDWPKSVVGHFDRKVYFVRGPQPYLAWRDDAQTEYDDPQTEFVAQFVTYPQNQINIAADGFVIRGARSGARCLVRVMSPVAKGKVAIEDLATETFDTRGKTYKYAKFYRGVTVTARALNPKFITVAFPFRMDNEVPRIALTTEPGDRLVCTLTFPDGRIDRLQFTSDNAALTRQAR